MVHCINCIFGNFRGNFIFANNVKSHIYDIKNSRLGHDLPISVNDEMISPFREGYIFTKFRENKALAKISEYTVLRCHKLYFPKILQSFL